MAGFAIADHARRLCGARGDRADCAMAQKARDCADRGAHDTAESWRAVRARIRILRAPNPG